MDELVRLLEEVRGNNSRNVPAAAPAGQTQDRLRLAGVPRALPWRAARTCPAAFAPPAAGSARVAGNKSGPPATAGNWPACVPWPSTVGGILATLRRELFDVVAELAVEEGLRIFAAAGDQPQVGERGNDAVVAGRAQLGRRVTEIAHRAGFDAGSAFAQKVLPEKSWSSCRIVNMD